jgi:peptidoglycan/xylan/chitin deacetylase (PgdA/CDA1 family)
MRVVAARSLSAVLLVAATAFVFQVDDSAPLARPTLATAPAFGASEGSPGREIVSSRRVVVPFGRTTLEVPILLYHYIRVPPPRKKDPIGYGLSVAPRTFSAQMDWLGAHGYHTVTFQDLRLYWRRVAPLPAKPVIVTLDDGYQDLYTTAFPILAAHGFVAVAYIVTGFVGEEGYVTRDQVLEMDRYGIEIGAHTVNHVDLARASGPWLTYQLAQSKAWLEKLVGHPVPDMAYPSGRYTAQTVMAVERAGYWSAVTTAYSYDHSLTDRFVWGRVRVMAGESMADFVKNLGPAMPTITITTNVLSPTPASMQPRT